MHAWLAVPPPLVITTVLNRIPVLVEGERLRPNLGSLLELADYVSMSAKFPQVPPVTPGPLH